MVPSLYFFIVSLSFAYWSFAYLSFAYLASAYLSVAELLFAHLMLVHLEHTQAQRLAEQSGLLRPPL